MQEKNICWGIIGCGNVAEVKSGPAFQKCKSSKLLAVMRRNALKAKDFAERHQVPLWYDDVTNILKNEEINAVYIATPPSTHLHYALKSLAAKKDVYLEKPMVISTHEATLLKKVVFESNNKLVVAHYRRQLPMFKKIRELVTNNSIGDIHFVDLKYLKAHKEDENWRLNPEISGGGHFHDIAPHQIDFMYYLFGDFNAAEGFSSNQIKNNTSDTVNGIINFKNGVQFRGIWCFNMPKELEEDSCIFYGSNGSISFSFFGNKVKLTINKKTETFDFEPPKHIQQPFIQQVTNYFLGIRTNPCSVEEGYIVNQIMDVFTKSKKN